jgi:hypothetical protein
MEFFFLQNRLVLRLFLCQSQHIRFRKVCQQTLLTPENSQNFSLKAYFMLVNDICVSFRMESGVDFLLEMALE